MITQPILPPAVLITVGVLTFGLVCTMAFTIRSTSTHRWSWILRGTMVLLVLTMAFRPSLPGGEGEQQASNFDVLFVVDTTNSMVAEDYNGNSPRLDGVEKDINSIAEKFAGSRFSIMTFGNSTYLTLPYTSDTDAVGSAADSMLPEITAYASGSSIDQPLKVAKKAMEERAKKKPDRIQLMFYFGDGEQTTKNKPKSMSPWKSLVKGGAVLGYGTSQGGKMKESLGYDSDDPIEYIKRYEDGEESDALSKIDEDNLKRIADEVGVTYSHRTGPSGIEDVVKSIQSQKYTSTAKNTKANRDLYWIFAFALGACALYECARISIDRSSRRRRKTP